MRAPPVSRFLVLVLCLDSFQSDFVSVFLLYSMYHSRLFDAAVEYYSKISIVAPILPKISFFSNLKSSFLLVSNIKVIRGEGVFNTRVFRGLSLYDS